MALEDRAPSVFTAVLILAVAAFVVFPCKRIVVTHIDIKAISDFETSTLVCEVYESMSANFKSPRTWKRQRLIVMQKAFGYDDWCMCIGIVGYPHCSTNHSAID